MTDLLQEKNSLTAQLSASVRELRKSGTEYANAEKNYKVLLRTECLKLRDEGMPVTLIEKTVGGVQSVADAKVKMRIAEAVYKANQEAINSIKLQLRLIEGQMSREWNSGEI